MYKSNAATVTTNPTIYKMQQQNNNGSSDDEHQVPVMHDDIVSSSDDEGENSDDFSSGDETLGSNDTEMMDEEEEPDDDDFIDDSEEIVDPAYDALVFGAARAFMDIRAMRHGAVYGDLHRLVGHRIRDLANQTGNAEVMRQLREHELADAVEYFRRVNGEQE